jgi:beta-lactamase regulating signal transducer with metallopeptidase domain/peroxiredoxin
MSAFSAWSRSIAGLAGDSIVLVLVVKWMVVLAMAWLAHGMLSGRNPRWRVALWRATVVGVALVAFLSSAPPIVEYRFAPAGPSAVEVVRSVSTAPAAKDRAAPEAVSVRESLEAIDPAPASAPVARTGGGTRPASNSQGVEPVPSAPAEGAGAPWGAGPGLWMGSIWLAGILVLTVRLIVGSLGLARLVRRSSEASDAIVRECRAVALRLGCRRVVRVRLTSEFSTPCLAGVVRPVLLLPEWECEDVRSADLRAILAHELAHARNHDLAWNFAAHVASILLWFHPLAWRIRAAHTAACDAVCDAVAVDLLGDVVSYGRVLARLALRVEWPSPAHGLAMARTSDVLRRLEALNRKVFRAPLSWTRVMPAICAGSLLLVLIGGFGFTRAEQVADSKASARAQTEPAAVPGSRGATSRAGDVPKPVDQPEAGRITLRAVAAQTGRPMEGVSVSYDGSFAEKHQKGTVATGKDGTVPIEYPSGSKVLMLEITATAPGHVPIFIRWDRFGNPVKIPPFQELRFERGTVIGGIVNDEAGKPVAGATVHRYSPPTAFEGARVVFMLKGPATDREGRWRMDDAPPSLADVTLAVVHPDYQTGSAPASRNLDSTIVLKKGFSVTGRVRDSGDRPVKGVKVMIGRDRGNGSPPVTTTDARGEFNLEKCSEGTTVVMVQAEGFAPQIRDVRVGDRIEPLVFRLEPASTLRVKVVDIQGKPVAGAFVFASSWRGHNSIALRGATDAEGRFTWRSAPGDVVLYDVGKPGFMARRKLPLAASEREQVVTLHPKLMITGRVSDAKTGRPLPECLIIEGVGFLGNDQISWSRGRATEVSGGEYTASFGEPNDAMYVRVEAMGYEPAVSRAFGPDEGRQSFDFALERATMLSGIVVRPDGKPADGVDVVLATEADLVQLDGGGFGSQTTAPRTKTGPDGRFAFTATKSPFLLIALCDAGYADASSEDFAKSNKLMLQPWGRLEGELKVGRQPKPNEVVSYNPVGRFGRGIANRLLYQYATRTDDHGRFTFERVIPGPGSVSRVVVTNFGRFSQHLTCGGPAVEIRPGQSTMVRIGGKGRPVTGRVVLDGTPETPIDWVKNSPVFMSRPKHENEATSSYVGAGSNIDKDGRFRLDDVTPGTYEMTISVSATSDPQVFDPADAIGWLQMSVTVPEVPGGQSDEPLDLGTITAKLFERLKVGDLAPDFAVPRIAGKGTGDQLRLVDYRGMLVLVDFWATWCRPCLAEMPALKDIQKTFSTDPRFNLISLACDQKDEAARQYIRENGLIWTHGFAGELALGVGLSYKVRSIPATFLIGPDGRILAKNLRGRELKEAIRMALPADERSRK